MEPWLAALEARHLADLTFPEVARALRALSSAYVERRARLREGAALSGAGKRAAFALFYGPLHFVLIDHIVRALPDACAAPALLDLGCGTGASGAAWALACRRRIAVTGVDAHPWAVDESRWTYRTLALDGRARKGDIAATPLPRGPAAILAAFAVNELTDDARSTLLRALIDRRTRGDRVLVVEPLARAVTPWWGEWRAAFAAAGGQADEWKFPAELPAIVAKLDRAAGLDHRQLTARTLYLAR